MIQCANVGSAGFGEVGSKGDSVNVITSVPACPSAQSGRTGPKQCLCDCALNIYTLVESTVFCVSISCSLPSGSQLESKLCVKCTLCNFDFTTTRSSSHPSCAFTCIFESSEQ